MTYNVGGIEAELRANFDDGDFRKFDAAVEKAKRGADGLDRALGKAAGGAQELDRAMVKATMQGVSAGKSYREIADDLGVSERALRDNMAAHRDYGRSAKGVEQSNDRMGRSWRKAATDSKFAGEVMDKQRQNLGKIGSAAKYAGFMLAGMATAGIGYGLKLNATWESNEAAFSTLLGSMEAAKEMTEDLRSVSSQSPLRLTSYQEAAKLLLGMEVPAKRVVPLLDAVNKAVVGIGGNEEQMQRVVMSLGQMQAKGKASAEELMQLAEAGLPVNKILQQELGLTAEQVGNIGNEGVKSSEAIEAIADGWTKKFGPAYKNAMDSGNFQSALARKNFEQLLRMGTAGLYDKLAKSTLPEVNKQLGAIIRIIDDPKMSGDQKVKALEKRFDIISEKLGDVVEEAMPRVLDALEKYGPKVAEAGGKLGVMLAASIAKSFVNSGWLGKLFIGGWLIHAIGGWPAIGRLGGRVGGRLATSLGRRFLAAVTPYIVGIRMVLENNLPGLRRRFGAAGTRLGRTLGVRIIAGMSLISLLAAVIASLPRETREGLVRAGSRMGRALRDGFKEGVGDLWDAMPNLPGRDAVKKAAGGAWGLVDKINMLDHLPGGGKHGGLVTDHGIVGMKTGGRVPGLHPDDTVPAMLEPGEFVIRKQTVDQLGLPFLRDLNRGGKVQEEADTGKDEIVGVYEEIDREVDKSTAKTEKTVVDRFSTMRKRSTDDTRKAQTSLRDQWAKIDRNQSDRLRSMDEQTRKRFGGMRETVTKRGGDMVSSMRSSMGSLDAAVSEGFGAIATQANKALSAFGVAPVNFGVKAAKGAKKHAGGGFIAGTGKQDTVPLVLGMAAPGEAILSGPQQAEVEQSLAVTREMGLGNYGSLDDLFRGVTTPHYAFARGGRIPGYAQGGNIVPVPGFPGERMNSRILGPALAFMRKWNLFLTDSYGSGHQSPEHTQYGTALDVVPGPGGSWGKVGQAVGEAVKLGYTPVYYDGSNGSINLPPHGPGHHAHITLLTVAELLAGQSPGGVAATNVARQILTGPDGAMKSGGQGALDKVRKAAQKLIGRKMATQTTAGGGFGGIEASGEYQSMGRQMMLRMWPASEWPALKELWTRESNWNPAARNPSSGAYGIPQSLPASKMGPAAQGTGPEAAKAQIAWGLKYIKERYGSPSAALGFHDGHNWYARGGRIPGYAKGGVIRGKVSRFDDHTTASGISARDNAGLALNMAQGTDSGWNNPKTQRWMDGARAGKPYYADVGINGKSGIFPIVDLGPAGWVNRAIDVSNKAAQKMGLSVSGFPTDAQGEAWLLGQSRRPRKGSPSYGGGKTGGAPAKEKKVWVPSGGVSPDGKKAGRWVTEAQLEREKRQRKKARRQQQRRWRQRRRRLRKGKKAAREDITLPNFRRQLRPRFTPAELAETEGWHDPIGDDVFAYDLSFDRLDRIDPRIKQLRERLLGSYDLHDEIGGRTLRDRYLDVDAINRQTTLRIGQMRRRMSGFERRDVKRKAVGWRRGGGIGPAGMSGEFDPTAKQTRKMSEKQIKQLYDREIKKRAALIRKTAQAQKSHVMAPVRRQRRRDQNTINRLNERGELLSNIVSETRKNISRTRMARTSQGAAFQFARGGRIGTGGMVAAGGGAPIVLVEITDPTLAALNPQIKVQVQDEFGRAGKQIQARGRAAGGGRKASL